MPKLHPAFIKIAASPSPSAWAQIYHAGNVYAIVSVQQSVAKEKDPEHALPSVHVLGKEIINNIEAEYFTIVEKNLQTIKEAIATACATIPHDVETSILIAVVIQQILYVFLYGKGDIFLKRGDKAGSILKHSIPNGVAAASGIIEPNDIVVLATPQFTKVVPFTELKNSLYIASEEFEEKYMSLIDDEQHAGAAIAIISFSDHDQIHDTMPPSPSLQSETHTIQTNISKAGQGEDSDTDTALNKPPPFEGSAKQTKITSIKDSDSNSIKDTEDKLSLEDEHHLEDEFEGDTEQPLEVKSKHIPLSLKRLFFLAAAVILAGILVFSIVKAIHKQTQDQSEVLFSSQFPAAQQKYDEGQNLLSLNKNLALDDFQKTKTGLEALKTKLPANSPHQSQINDLLTKIKQALGSGTGGQQTSLTAADSGSKLLSAEITSHASYITQDDKGIYSVDNTAISSVGTTDTTTIVKNNNDWTEVGGFGTYLGNFYVADKKANQILKFAKSDNRYDKSNYLKDTSDVSKTISLTIDGSIWILSDDGSIKKFTKGVQDKFSIEQLQKPLAHPTRIFTTDSIDNLYILDPQNARILSIKKDGGTLVQEYDAKELKDAKDIDVDEKNKKIYVLIGDKIFSMDIK